jgi:hypothetical protein
MAGSSLNQTLPPFFVVQLLTELGIILIGN